ncbi:MAG: hypothetical protein ACPG6V_09045 [Flavobacteriales bacterium]
MKTLSIFIGFVLFLTFGNELFAQGCSMCKAVVESNIEGGGEEASGLNAGILYILFFPYILFTLFVWYWRKHQKEISKDQTV